MGRYLNEFEVEKIFCMSGLPVSLFSIVKGFFMCKHALVFGINAFFYSIISVLMTPSNDHLTSSENISFLTETNCQAINSLAQQSKNNLDVLPKTNSSTTWKWNLWSKSLKERDNKIRSIVIRQEAKLKEGKTWTFPWPHAVRETVFPTLTQRSLKEE